MRACVRAQHQSTTHRSYVRVCVGACRCMRARVHVRLLRGGWAPELIGNVLEQCGEEVHVLWEDSRVLDPQEAGAAELAILDVEVQLAAALGLPRVVPVDVLAAFVVKRNGDHLGCAPIVTSMHRLAMLYQMH